MSGIKILSIRPVQYGTGNHRTHANRQDQIIPMKFSSMRRPTAPLFSGWNWTP